MGLQCGCSLFPLYIHGIKQSCQQKINTINKGRCMCLPVSIACTLLLTLGEAFVIRQGLPCSLKQKYNNNQIQVVSGPGSWEPAVVFPAGANRFRYDMIRYDDENNSTDA